MVSVSTAVVAWTVSVAPERTEAFEESEGWRASLAAVVSGGGMTVAVEGSDVRRSCVSFVQVVGMSRRGDGRRGRNHQQL